MNRLADVLKQHGLPSFNLQESADDTNVSMLEHMGVYMHAALWPLGVDLIKTNSVPAEDAYEFVRRAIHVIDPTDFVLFLIEMSDSIEYDFFKPTMLHYIAPILCAYFSTFPLDTSALYGLLKLDMLRRSPIIIEEVCLISF